MKIYLYHMKICRLFVLLFSLVTASVCLSQSKEFNLTNYTQEQGLPSNETYFVYRDSKNYLWIATDKGVVRFDGQVMQTFKLPDNVVFKIREDHKGRIWFFSHTGKLAYFFNETIYPYVHNDKIAKEIANMLIVDAYVDKDDNIVINSGQRYNYKVSSTGSIEKYDYSDLNSTAYKYTITQIGKNDFFPQLLHFNFTVNLLQITRNDSLGPIQYKIPAVLTEHTHYGCKSIDGRNLYFFASNVLVKLTQEGSFVTQQFPSNILCLGVNKTGDVWVGLTKGGAVLMDSNLNKMPGLAILPQNSVSSISQDYEGGTWFSTLEKGLFHLKNIRINYWSGDHSLSQDIYRIYSHDDQTLLFGTARGVYQVVDQEVKQVVKQALYVSDLFTDDNKNIYVAGNLNSGITHERAIKEPGFFYLRSTTEISRYKDKMTWSHGGFLLQLELPGFPQHTQFSKSSYPNDSTPQYKLGFVFAGRTGQHWLGSATGLWKYYPSLDSLEPFKPSSTILSQGITCMRQLDNGLYTVGIRFGGIMLIQDTSIVATITEKEGLLSNSVKYLLPVKDQLWAATAKGVSVIQFLSYQPLRYTITNIGRNEGLYNIIINQLVQHQGNILAATSNGIYAIERPQELLEKFRPEIPFYINNIRYYKGDTTGVSRLRVPYSENSFSIKYSALSFTSAFDLKYYYRFANKDTNWQVTTNTELTLENLAPGTYNIEIKAGIPNEHRWSAIQQLEIIINKPWWQNNWLRLGGLTLLIGLIVFFYNKRIAKIRNQERQKLAIKTMMVEMEQKLLHSQMNPHFIFNSLSSIQQLIVSGDRREANDYLVKLARLIRQTLDLSARSFITVEEEKDYLAEYLVLEQYRMPSLFDFKIHIDPAIDAARTEVPNMMLQPIIENCIRHGIKHLANKKGLITIEMKKKDAHIDCIITDNGVGRTKTGNNKQSFYTEHKSYGMEIVRKRLAILMTGKASEDIFQIYDLANEDGSPAGTRVILHLPYKTILS